MAGPKRMATTATAMSVFLGLLYTPLSATAQSGYDYNGGVAMRYPNQSCPAGTFYQGTSFEPNCCPDGTYPAPGGSSYCCPTEDDCGKEVQSNVKCADPAWIYCPSPNNAPLGFCCLNGWKCFEQLPTSETGSGVGCGPPGYQLQFSQTPVPTAWGAYEGPGQSTSTTSTTSTTSSSTSFAVSTSSPATSAPPAAVSNTGSSPTSAKQPTSGLSSGAKVGIGVGVALGVVAVLAGAGIAVYVTRRKRKNRQIPERKPSISGKPELSGEGIAAIRQEPPKELGTEENERKELDTPEIRHELPGDEPLAEAPSDPNVHREFFAK